MAIDNKDKMNNKRVGSKVLVSLILMAGTMFGSTITFGTQTGGTWTDGVGTPVQTGPVPATYVTPDEPYQWISDGNTFVGDGVITRPNGYVDSFFYSFTLPVDSVVISATEKVCADDSAGVSSNGIFLGRVTGFSGDCHTIDFSSTLHAGVNQMRYEVRQEHSAQYGLYVKGSVEYNIVPKTPEPGTWMMLLGGLGMLAAGKMRKLLTVLR